MTEDAVANLIGRGATAVQIAGWPPGSTPKLDRVARLSEFGLRLPVAIYVHLENIERALELAEAALVANYHAGVSFEPACSHPLFRESDVTMLPSAAAYSEFLVAAFQRFRHYDDVFQPIASLVENLRLGACHPDGKHGLVHRFRINERGVVREFRQFPLCDDSGQATDVVEIKLAPQCGACRWRGMCGGCEDADSRAFELVCNYRMLFLEFFVREMHNQLGGVEEN